MPLLTHLYRNHWNFERHILHFNLFMHNEKLRKRDCLGEPTIRVISIFGLTMSTRWTGLLNNNVSGVSMLGHNVFIITCMYV